MVTSQRQANGYVRWAVVAGMGLGLLAARPATASPVTFGTFLSNLETTTSQFSLASQSATGTSPGVSTSASADLGAGKLRASNVGSGVNISAGTNSLFFDTLTFSDSAFEGVFGTSYTLELNAHFDGIFNHTGQIDSGGATGLLRVYSGDSAFDSNNFADFNSLVGFLFTDPSRPTPLCTTNVTGANFATASNGAFGFDLACTVTVTQATPTIRILMNMGTSANSFNNSAVSWNINMLNSGTLSADFGGREVTSASGAFPGTAVAAVPEPATMGLVGAGLILACLRRRPRR